MTTTTGMTSRARIRDWTPGETDLSGPHWRVLPLVGAPTGGCSHWQVLPLEGAPTGRCSHPLPKASVSSQNPGFQAVALWVMLPLGELLRCFTVFAGV